jgi:NADPH:quinone reductase-like Zn-dependent oxidoreductase
VVDFGGGIRAWRLKGKRVAFTRQREDMSVGKKLIFGGTMAQYAITEASQCVILPDEIPFDKGATAIYNYLAAYGLLEKALEGNPDTVVVTAASSTVGTLLIKLFEESNVKVIATVRSEEQKQNLINNFG